MGQYRTILNSVSVRTMGGSESRTAVESLSSAISNVVISTVQSCEVAATQDQTLVVTNTGFKLWGTYKLDQQSDISASCFSDVNKQTDIQNKIIDTIAQSTSASNIALLGAFGSSSADARAALTNIVKNNITMSNIQNSYTTIKQNQAARFSNSGVIGFEQVELTQGSKLFAAAALQEIDRAGIFNQVASYVDQHSTATMENPLDFIAKIFGAVTGTMLVTILLIIVIIAAIVFGGMYVVKLLNSADR